MRAAALVIAAGLAAPSCCTCPLDYGPAAEPPAAQVAGAPAIAPVPTGPAAAAKVAGTVVGVAASAATGNPLVGEAVGWLTVTGLSAVLALAGRRRRPRR